MGFGRWWSGLTACLFLLAASGARAEDPGPSLAALRAASQEDGPARDEALAALVEREGARALPQVVVRARGRWRRAALSHLARLTRESWRSADPRPWLREDPQRLLLELLRHPGLDRVDQGLVLQALRGWGSFEAVPELVGHLLEERAHPAQASTTLRALTGLPYQAPAEWTAWWDEVAPLWERHADLLLALEEGEERALAALPLLARLPAQETWEGIEALVARVLGDEAALRSEGGRRLLEEACRALAVLGHARSATALVAIRDGVGVPPPLRERARSTLVALNLTGAPAGGPAEEEWSPRAGEAQAFRPVPGRSTWSWRPPQGPGAVAPPLAALTIPGSPGSPRPGPVSPRSAPAGALWLAATLAAAGLLLGLVLAVPTREPGRRLVSRRSVTALQPPASDTARTADPAAQAGGSAITARLARLAQEPLVEGAAADELRRMAEAARRFEEGLASLMRASSPPPALTAPSAGHEGTIPLAELPHYEQSPVDTGVEHVAFGTVPVPALFPEPAAPVAPVCAEGEPPLDGRTVPVPSLFAELAEAPGRRSPRDGGTVPLADLLGVERAAERVGRGERAS